jgi:hypothetical protein
MKDAKQDSHQDPKQSDKSYPDPGYIEKKTFRILNTGVADPEQD